MNIKKILLVEDETPLLRAMQIKFSQEGFNVLQAHDGQEGLRIALSEHPDLILSDIVMPKMDGMNMIRKIRDDEWGKNAQIVLLTNLNESSDVTEALELGIFDFLVKSNWKLQDLVKKVKEKVKI